MSSNIVQCCVRERRECIVKYLWVMYYLKVNLCTSIEKWQPFFCAKRGIFRLKLLGNVAFRKVGAAGNLWHETCIDCALTLQNRTPLALVINRFRFSMKTRIVWSKPFFCAGPRLAVNAFASLTASAPSCSIFYNIKCSLRRIEALHGERVFTILSWFCILNTHTTILWNASFNLSITSSNHANRFTRKSVRHAISLQYLTMSSPNRVLDTPLRHLP